MLPINEGHHLWVLGCLVRGKKSPNDGYMTLQVVFNDNFEFWDDSSLDMI